MKLIKLQDECKIFAMIQTNFHDLLSKHLNKYTTAIFLICSLSLIYFISKTFKQRGDGKIGTASTFTFFLLILSYFTITIAGLLHSFNMPIENITNEISQFSSICLYSLSYILITLYTIEHLPYTILFYFRYLIVPSTILCFCITPSILIFTAILFTIILSFFAFNQKLYTLALEYGRTIKAATSFIKKHILLFLSFFLFTSFLTTVSICAFSNIIHAYKGEQRYSVLSLCFGILFIYWVLRFFNQVNRFFAASFFYNASRSTDSKSSFNVLQKVFTAMQNVVHLFSFTSLILAIFDTVIFLLKMLKNFLISEMQNRPERPVPYYYLKLFLYNLYISFMEVIENEIDFFSNLKIALEAKQSDEKDQDIDSISMDKFDSISFIIFFVGISMLAYLGGLFIINKDFFNQLSSCFTDNITFKSIDFSLFPMLLFGCLVFNFLNAIEMICMLKYLL